MKHCNSETRQATKFQMITGFVDLLYEVQVTFSNGNLNSIPSISTPNCKSLCRKGKKGKSHGLKHRIEPAHLFACPHLYHKFYQQINSFCKDRNTSAYVSFLDR